MRVYRDNKEIVNIVIDNKTQLKKFILGEDFVQSSFIIESYFDFQIGDYINWRGKKYTILKQPSVKKVQATQFQYAIDFRSDQYQFQNALYLFDKQAEFDLVGDFLKFANLVIVNMNRIAGESYYQLGEVSNTEVKNLHFDNFNCFYVVQFLCKEFEKEFYFSEDGKTLNFVDKIGNDTGLSFQFRNGLRNIERQKVTDKNLVTRLYAFGGERNITKEYGGAQYTGKRLRLSNESRYLEQNTELFGVIEGVVNFDDVYPHRVGIVSTIDSENIFKFTDASMDFNLNDQLIEGVVAKLTFNTGKLAGYEFEISQYAHSSKRFTIIQYQDTNGFALPSEDFKIEIGDEYVLHDIKMPQSYIDQAEQGLEKKAKEYLKQNSLPNAVYTIIPDYTYLRKKLIQLNVGDVITIRDDEFGLERQTRIISLTQSLANEYLYTIKVGDKITVSYLNRIVADGLKNENSIRLERYNREIQYNRIRRNLKTIDELKDAIFDPDGYFDTDNIKPLSIETNMLSVGAKGQQFVIRNLLIEANYQSNANKIKCGNGVLVHFTIEDEIKEWNLAEDVFALDDPSAPYYIYAKCVKDGNTGLFELTTDQYNTDQNEYYYFLIGVVHSVFDNVRGISLTYGQTTINGKFVTTGRVQSIDGYNFFDLDMGQFNLGDETSGLDWNVSEKEKLTIRGGLVQSHSGDTFPIAVYKEQYKDLEFYYKGDQVSYNGSTYIFIGETPQKGIAPTNTDYWRVSAQSGADGQDGKDGKTGVDGRDGQDGQDGKTGVDGRDGLDGRDGKDGTTGAGIVFRGLFNPKATYYNNSIRKDVVKNWNRYYLYKGKDSVSLEWSSANWQWFGAQFDSVATGLLLAESANIADWIIKDGKITSQNTYNGKPRMQFDGRNGKITLVSSTQKTYTYTGGKRSYEQTIKLDSKTGMVEAKHEGDSFQTSGTSQIDSEGIIANFAGKQAVAISSGIEIKGAIVGIGNGKLNRNAYSESGVIAGVVGRAKNLASDPAPAYGGLFFGLKTYGLFYNVKVLNKNITSYTVLGSEDYISCYNYSTLHLYLPTSNRHPGRIIYVKRINKYIKIHGNGKNLMLDKQYGTIGISKDGDCWMFVFDGFYWCAQKLVR